ncbi:hypothetical protein [Rhodopseudomonas pseudopalustris]|uniref:hypothetical protein n=1 Tax=Rhodopseudomonas pseudopalustris TaxID=1513892 RepID=UPI000B0C7190|nr:hypothetical protein [Rhodopseudomonas pseudopalustris]
MKQRGPKTCRSGWRQSVEFLAIGREAITRWNAERVTIDRCGAKRKHGMGPCRQWPMANGRCYLHGGRTPRKDQWHVMQLPDCSTPKGGAKFERKLRDKSAYANKQAVRVAAMTPDEQKAHRAWHRARKPGSGVAREAAAVRARQNGEVRRLLAAEPPERRAGPELELARTELAAAEARLAKLTSQAAGAGGDDEGIFG